MKFVKLRLFMMCTALLLTFAAPVQMKMTDQGMGVKYAASVDAKVKKKSVKKKKAKKAVVVYVTSTGECYHTHACGRGNYDRSPLKDAKAQGLRPCKKCY